MTDLYRQVGQMIRTFVSDNPDNREIRSKYVLPAKEQPKPVEQEQEVTDTMYQPKSWSGPIDTKSDDNFGLWDSKELDQPHDPEEGERNRLVNMGIQYEKNGLSVQRSEEDARNMHWQYLKKTENGNDQGLRAVGPGDERYFPIKSGEGRGPDKTMSEFEIGHGIKIPEKWLTDKESDWPLINGVRVDVRQGIDKQQEEAMTRTLLGLSYKAAKSQLTHWDSMKPSEKAFWADLVYNGGEGAIKKNPMAMRAANRGDTVEAMVLALDYIKAGGKVSRGLLNRRISMYNKAAMEIPGCPVIREYKFGDGIHIKFAHGFDPSLISKNSSIKYDDEGWYKLYEGQVNNKEINKKMGDDLRFYS